jgi:hypothetical protein
MHAKFALKKCATHSAHTQYKLNQFWHFGPTCKMSHETILAAPKETKLRKAIFKKFRRVLCVSLKKLFL